VLEIRFLWGTLEHTQEHRKHTRRVGEERESVYCTFTGVYLYKGVNPLYYRGKSEYSLIHLYLLISHYLLLSINHPPLIGHIKFDS
jgi:hypothetical protein